MEPPTCPESISDNPKGFLMQDLYYFLRLEPGSGPDMEPSTCPESISDNPKSALGWPSQFAYFLKFHFFTFKPFLKRGSQCKASGASTQRKK